MSPDSDFEDDDDELLMALVRQTQLPLRVLSLAANDAVSSSRDAALGLSLGAKDALLSTQAHPNGTLDTSIQASDSADIRERLYKADGEASILRNQLHQLRRQRLEESSRLREQHRTENLRVEEQVNDLKFMVQKLQDEKQFLTNEIRSFSSVAKRRKTVPTSSNPESLSSDQAPAAAPVKLSGAAQNIIRIADDSSLLTDHLWSYCINGCNRTSFAFLDKICIDRAVAISDEFRVVAKAPLSKPILEFLMMKKSLRLDDLIYSLVTSIVELIKILLIYFDRENGSASYLLPVPFFLSLVHAALTYKTSAITRSLLHSLIRDVAEVAQKFIFLLDSSQNENDLINYYDVPYQHMLLENFILLSSFDILETATAASAAHGSDFVREIWASGVLSSQMLSKVLPDNMERFKTSAQINLIYNCTEMILASISEASFAFHDAAQNKALLNSLFKVLLLDIPLKDDFMFFGLNRVLGNNCNLDKFRNIVPETETLLKQTVVSMPCPVAKGMPSQEDEMLSRVRHENHLLVLRINILNFIENVLHTDVAVKFMGSKETIKSVMRIIGFQQNSIMNFPRSRVIHHRIHIVGTLVRLLYYVLCEEKSVGALMYPETFYEVLVVLMRIAFSSGQQSLADDGYELLRELRGKGYFQGVFNQVCEFRSRDLTHLPYAASTVAHKENREAENYATMESNFANGLEFPYEQETVELAREILGFCVNDSEADNLYMNMTFDDLPEEAMG